MRRRSAASVLLWLLHAASNAHGTHPASTASLAPSTGTAPSSTPAACTTASTSAHCLDPPQGHHQQGAGSSRPPPATVRLQPRGHEREASPNSEELSTSTPHTGTHTAAHVQFHTTPRPALTTRRPTARTGGTPDDVDGGSSTSNSDETPTTGRVASRALLEWEEFKRKNNKSYPNRTEFNKMNHAVKTRGFNTNPSELLSDEDRMNLFTARKLAIEEHNKHVKSFKRSVNHFADMTVDEVTLKHTGLILSGRKPKGGSWDPRAIASRAAVPLPRHFDWRDRGALTEPRNQGPCGCCWAFAATAALEAKIFIRTKKLVALSEQHLLDCDNLDDKCDGGTPWDAFDWLQRNGGQEESEKYPYEVLDRTRMFKLQLKGYMSVRPSTEENLMWALYLEGPLTVAVNALLASFQDYQEGVYVDVDCSSNEDDLHHAMVLVGWGEDLVEGPYWTLRNSWGREWGENGHIRISRRDNLCGVMSYAVFPSLTTSDE